MMVDLPARPGPGRLELRDALGRLVHQQALPMANGDARLPVAYLAAGLHTCALVVNEHVVAARRVAVQ